MSSSTRLPLLRIACFFITSAILLALLRNDAFHARVWTPSDLADSRTNSRIGKTHLSTDHQEVYDSTFKSSPLSSEEEQLSVHQSAKTHRLVSTLIPGSSRRKEADFLRNKTILCLGDSVLREVVKAFCATVQETPTVVKFDGQRFSGNKGTNTHTHSCVQKKVNLQLLNAFVYGMPDYNNDPLSPKLTLSALPDTPFNFEDRINEYERYLRDYQVDTVLVNTAAWDFKYLYRKELYLDQQKGGKGRYDALFSQAVIDEYTQRLKKYLQLTRKVFPKAQIVFLGVQPFSAEDEIPRYHWGKPFYPPNLDKSAKLAVAPPLFSPERVAQMSKAYDRVVEGLGIPKIDTVQVGREIGMDKFFKAGDVMHPNVEGSMRLLDVLLEYMYRLEKQA